MKTKELLEEINSKEVTYAFWVNEQGNLLMDINDKEELRDYIKNRADTLNDNYKTQLRGTDVRNLSIPEIINRISWFYITLYGYKKTFSLHVLGSKEENKKKEVKGTIYNKMKIRTDLKIDPNKKLKNKIIERIIASVKQIYPSIDRIKVFGANDVSTEFYL